MVSSIVCVIIIIGFNECLILLQYTSKFGNVDIVEILNRISHMPIDYINCLFLPDLLEKVYEKFYKEQNFAKKLVNDINTLIFKMERIGSSEVYQTNFEWKNSKLFNHAKVKLIRLLYDLFCRTVVN
jgi:hypothetical protein